MRKGVKRALGLGVLAGAAYAAWRAFEKSRPEPTLTWQPRPFPYPPEAVATPSSADTASATSATDGGAANDAPWLDAVDGECPVTHPVKAKLASGIFHEEGGANYARTKADRCYATPAAAEADGLRPAKR